jgi:proprotein convertase subtilisin/kexin type 5
MSGFTLSSDACYYCSNVAHCTTCIADNTCGTCAATYTLSSGKCYLCTTPSHCTTCTASQHCGTCDNSGTYTLYNGNCFDCTAVADCATCTADGYCGTCNAGYTANGGICVACNVVNCDVCTSSNTCGTCASGYTLDNNHCYSCGPDKCAQCLTCNAVTSNCTSCTPYGTLYLYSGSCYANCPSGTFNDQSTCRCTDCATGCKVCYGSTADKCTSCTNDTTTSPATKYYKLANIDTCDTSCGNYYYGDATSNSC